MEDSKGAPTKINRAATEQGAASTSGGAGGYRSHAEDVTEEPSPLSPTIRFNRRWELGGVESSSANLYR